ncbi:3'-5' exonuclease [Xenorhabdus bovienii]|uniref:DNA-directed DNA polymerase n=1 Tax=Xenorhabdus bovienii TaxID=40576 RepID=A0AAJ1N3L6_XENBV|nr:3'-5' exonuclease [Xenorhabdus bovienii]MDE1480492.1 3'-5' exonuclease [Xenorhabdus bovienii]MDE9512174.1 3'-5' exonuclease [Xenorhabdus bovienii]MDE9523835.1 3'-5' exonuclease [Xenorhabdus bovienii]
MRNRQQAQLIAEQILKEDIVILDTETTGLKSDDEIIEISIINADGNVLLDTLIKPQKKIPPDATRIHRITNEDVQHKPLWSDVYKKYREIVKGKTVIIYNKSYDTKIIRQTCKKYELPTPKIKSECAMLLYAEYYGEINERTGDYKWHKLTDAIHDNKIEVSGEAHRALTDARMTLELMKRMAYGDCNTPIPLLRSIYPPINPEYEKYKRKKKEEERLLHERKEKLKKEEEARALSRYVNIVFTCIHIISATQLSTK